MKTMSAIYQKVRHRLNDDWAYGNGELPYTNRASVHLLDRINHVVYLNLAILRDDTKGAFLWDNPDQDE